MDHEGTCKEITKESDPELFYAILGGSPGNFGILTHFTLEAHRDSDHEGSRGLKSLYWYDPDTLRRLLDIFVAVSDDEKFPRNYDFCVSVLSSSFKLLDLWPELDGAMREDHPEIYGENDMPFWPRTIVVYAQWVPFDKNDTCDMAWADSEMDFPECARIRPSYIKRTYATSSTTLGKDGWASWVTDRINAIVVPEKKRCWLSAQLQYFGGKYSKFTTNADNGTSYSWRDSTILCTLDCFHSSEGKSRAEDWQRGNDAEGIGPNGFFSKQDRRVLWGSYGSFDLDASRAYHYEDQAKYERLQKARQAADPAGTFTPNTFAVKRWAGGDT
ncbi:hypothetical protein BDW75DRAFT_246335 [Aspergillus navahoensis]